VCDRDRVWVRRRGSGLLEPFTVPRLTIAEAADRGWQPREGGRLLEQKPPAYLPTYPLPQWVMPLPPPWWARYV
jgi:hypothetical protein